MARPGGRHTQGGGDRNTRGDAPRDDGHIETVVKINRCAKVMKGGRRFSFSALVVVGDGNGKVGFGFGKANDVPTSVEKGMKEARRSMTPVAMVGRTVPHEAKGRFGAARVIVLPAAPGTGVIAGASMRAVLVAAGIQDVLTKSLGSANPVNLVKATMDALGQMRTREQVEALRGVTITV
jgi:small subunit ribosomal protein S5